MHERPTTLVETEELIARVELGKCDCEQHGERAAVCDCEDTLDELWSIWHALKGLPEPRQP